MTLARVIVLCWLALAMRAATASAEDAPAASWAAFVTGTIEGINSPKVFANPAGGFYLHSIGDRPLIKYNPDASVAWEIRKEPGTNDVHEFFQMDILPGGDVIAIVGAFGKPKIFGQQFEADGRWVVKLRGSDAAPQFVMPIENCWLTAVRALPSGAFLVAGLTFGAAKIGSIPLGVTGNHVFIAQISTALDWIATGDFTDFNDSIEAIRIVGSGASLQISAAGTASQIMSFGGKAVAQPGAYLLTLSSSGATLDARVIVPKGKLLAFEPRPGGGAHFAATTETGANDLLRLNRDGSTAWSKSVNGRISALTATDEAFVTGSIGIVGFTEAYDAGGNTRWRREEASRGYDPVSGAAVLSDGRLLVSGSATPGGIFIDDFFLGDFSLIQRTTFGAYLAIFDVTAAARPVVRVQPRDQKFAVRSETVTLHTEIYSPTALTLQWYKDGSKITGQTAADLILPNVQAAARGKYFLEASNAAGLTRSAEVEVVVNSVSVTTLAGTDAPDVFDSPRSVVLSLNGSLLVADAGKDLIQRVTPTGISTFAGSTAGLSNGLPTEAQFSSPSGLAIEWRYETPTLYVADSGNNLLRRIRFSDATGEATSVNQVDQPLNGASAIATLDGTTAVVIGTVASPTIWKLEEGVVSFIPASVGFGATGGLAFDQRANLYVADSARGELRRMKPNGEMQTIGYNLSDPRGIAIDESGNLYVVQRGAHTIVKISPTGTQTPIAGHGMPGLANGSSAEAMFDSPEGICFRNDTLIVADTANHCLREIHFTPLSANALEVQIALGATLTIAVSGSASQDFTIESSPQMGPSAQWQTAGTIAGGQSLNLQKPTATRFYRARQLP